MPNGDQGTQYIEALKLFLRDMVKKGKLSTAQAEEAGGSAVELLNTHGFGIWLPYFNEVYQERKWWRPDPKWRLGREAAMPPELAHYSALGLSPSEALSWAKYMQPEEVEEKPEWTMGWEGKEYTPEQWQAVWPALRWKGEMERDWRTAQLQQEVSRLELRLKEQAMRAMGRSKARAEYGWLPYGEVSEGYGGIGSYRERQSRRGMEEQIGAITGEAPADLYKRYLVGGQ